MLGRIPFVSNACVISVELFMFAQMGVSATQQLLNAVWNAMAKSPWKIWGYLLLFPFIQNKNIKGKVGKWYMPVNIMLSFPWTEVVSTECVWVCVCACTCARMHPCTLSCVWLFETPWTVIQQAPLSTEFLGQEYLSGLPFPSPGDLPNSGIKPSLMQWRVGSLPMSHLGSPFLQGMPEQNYSRGSP